MSNITASIDHATGLTSAQLDAVVRALMPATQCRRGRPWARSLRDRVKVVCLSLCTNLTLREIGGMCTMSKSQVHRILADLIRALPR